VRDTVAGRRVAAYREEQLRDLLERVREGFVLCDLGQIDVVELDELIARYRHAALLLRRFCGSEDLEWECAERDLAFLRERGEAPDWWGAAGLVADR
jgi:hypothetical protein